MFTGEREQNFLPTFNSQNHTKVRSSNGFLYDTEVEQQQTEQNICRYQRGSNHLHGEKDSRDENDNIIFATFIMGVNWKEI